MVCETCVQLDWDFAGTRGTIHGEIVADRLATLDLSRVTATGQRVRRSAQRIARSSEDRFHVSIQTRGNGFVIQDGRTAKLVPGDNALYDSTRPYELVFESAFQQYVLMLPAALAVSPSRLTGWHRERIKACVLARLRDPELSVTSIAAELHLSPSTLHRVWGDNGHSLSEWIWMQRFNAARRDLCDPVMAAHGVSEVAFSWGFNGAAHFSRGFKARFGCTPRDRRAAH